jgi:hypothetical protein
VVLELRDSILEAEPALYESHREWITDETLMRFLIARKFDCSAALTLISEALKWRELRQPSRLLADPDSTAKMSIEAETGKIYFPGSDRWGRPVLVLNNQVQNTACVEDQMKYLAWSLELAVRCMPPAVDKYCIFIHLDTFSFFNMPPFQSTRETLQMLCDCFPERLGHCIIYLPPTIFYTFFSTIKMFIDPKTVSKLVFILGDVSDGSDNDVKMKDLVGDDWRVLTGAGQPVLRAGCSPGFDFSEYWPTIEARLAALQ